MNELRRFVLPSVALAVAITACGDGNEATRPATTAATRDSLATTTPILPSPVTTASPAPTVNCSEARIVRPGAEASVSAGRVVLDWEPASCVLDVATYQNGALVEKRTGVRAGADFELPPPVAPASSVRTELKIWRSGDPLPVHAIWVVVRS